jgi:hypothetical protein
LFLSSDDPTAEVEVEGKTYTVELVSASDSAASVRLTDEDGNTETKEIDEDKSKQMLGLAVAVTTADETNLKLSATITVGSDKITLPAAGGDITVGEDADPIDGTHFTLIGTDSFANANITKFDIAVGAPNSDEDFIKPGDSFVDPVFGISNLISQV